MRVRKVGFAVLEKNLEVCVESTRQRSRSNMLGLTRSVFIMNQLCPQVWNVM